ncbi:IPExxxVDY family protein [Aquiflexum gelatinilyticum]|uniref:IPExxxVDY family protein n=1 Tax=Aquiflexum gelatinilyticum TaxID=2961943 RepID=UPI002167E5B7|nr:IPExxxVDY family protein [Aquiflexum gelatinilyticum]MCS4433626.1 IPExxxVDY family protein [Aquiflexum gelatinilyticum]
MKRNKLVVEHLYEFELLGFVAPVKDYKMAWIINNALDLKLAKTDDYELEFISSTRLCISQYKSEKENGFIQLLKNKSFGLDTNSLYLIPELKIIDYFLLIQDFTSEVDINDYIERLSGNGLIQNVVKLDIDKIKSKENLLTY